MPFGALRKGAEAARYLLPKKGFMWLYSGVAANLLLTAGWRRMRPGRPCRMVWMLSAPPLDNLLVVD